MLAGVRDELTLDDIERAAVQLDATPYGLLHALLCTGADLECIHS